MAEIGQTLGGRYRLIELLGSGGMATIYRATDTQLGRDVALKLLRPEYLRDPDFASRFRQEAQAAASLSHPNVVTVYDFGEDPSGPYIVMELVDGEDLATILRRSGALPPRQVARIGSGVARALAAAHARGLVHRDVKPGNILIGTDGQVKVADFGIARAIAEAQVTLPGMTLGSVHYFSPEQARGEQATTASDIYSLGIVLYEMLTGVRPWEGDSAASVALARLSGPIPDPADRPAVRAARPRLDHPQGAGARSERPLAVGGGDGRRPRGDAPARRRGGGRCGGGSRGSGRSGRRGDDGLRDRPPQPERDPLRPRRLCRRRFRAELGHCPDDAASAADGRATRRRRPGRDEPARVDRRRRRGPAPCGDRVPRLPARVAVAGRRAAEQVAVPNLVGLDSATAARRAAALDLTLTPTGQVSSDHPEGQVLSQDPIAGTKVDRGTAIEVTVATGSRHGRGPRPQEQERHRAHCRRSPTPG